VQLDVFQVLADPTRRRIVSLLRAGEQQVGDVVEQVGINQSGVSRHLRILSESGFVSMRPDGQRRLYALKPGPFRELDAWIGPYRDLWEARLDRFGAALEKKRSAPRSPDPPVREAPKPRAREPEVRHPEARHPAKRSKRR
jgi:DNA-binding transcriptional ArsR family regulator